MVMVFSVAAAMLSPCADKPADCCQYSEDGRVKERIESCCYLMWYGLLVYQIRSVVILTPLGLGILLAARSFSIDEDGTINH